MFSLYLAIKKEEIKKKYIRRRININNFNKSGYEQEAGGSAKVDKKSLMWILLVLLRWIRGGKERHLSIKSG